MRKWTCLLVVALVLLLSACRMSSPLELPEQTEASAETEQNQATTEPVTTEATQTTAALTETPATTPEAPAHSAMYLPGIETDSVIRWFNEVVLDAEFVDGGDATLVQKWEGGISYAVLGAPTDTDLAVVSDMVSSLNGISGFPGMYEVSDPELAKLKIHFVSSDELLNILGSNYAGVDGGITFWYDDNNCIFEGVICIRTDLDQYVRNSVIQEEIYNGMGPVQDTDLREDSLIYSGYTTPQQMTAVDALIMKLLYHPDIKCGMTAQECEAVIRQLYY